MVGDFGVGAAAEVPGRWEPRCYLDATMPGMFVTFEGLDGSGKSSHLRRVAGEMGQRGVPHRVTHEPGGTPFGNAVRAVFLDPRWGALDGTVELLLVFASRRQHLLEVIEPSLDAGCHVLCDRFTDSSRAYQGFGRGVPLALIDQVDRLATGGRRPDRTVLFDLPPEAAHQRGHWGRRAAGTADRLDAEDLAFYGRVREGFLELAAAEPDRFRVVDSGGAIESTAEQVRAALPELLGEGAA
jgi:dTMP kinase